MFQTHDKEVDLLLFSVCLKKSSALPIYLENLPLFTNFTCDCAVNRWQNVDARTSMRVNLLTLEQSFKTCACPRTIDDFRGACAVKGNVQVAGHVKRVDHGDAFNA